MIKRWGHGLDSLNNQERILAWKASWHPSFDGIAIINPDFTFRSVNPQFCKLLGVSPADLINQRFQDVTHPDLRRIDEENAKLLIKGAIDFYILPKKYLFQNGHQVAVILMMTRVPYSADGVFQFFLSRIMLDENGALSINPKAPRDLEPSCPSLMAKAGDFLARYYKLFIGLGSGIAAIIVYLFEYFKGE